MRASIALVIVTLTLGFGIGPVPAETEYGTLKWIHMMDPSTGWALNHQCCFIAPAEISDARGGVETVVRTIDGGIHWRDVTPPEPPGQQVVRLYNVDVLNSLIAWAATGTTSGTLLLSHTVDGGQTWNHMTIPAYGSIYFVDTRNGWLMSVGQIVGRNEEADIYRSSDRGATWIKVASTRAGNERSGLPFAGRKEDITFLNTTTGWITGTRDPGDASNSAYFYVTHDGGRTWRLQELPSLSLTIPYHAYSPTIRFFTARDGILSRVYSVPNNVYPVVSGVLFYVTHDGGTTWTPTTPPYATPLTSSPNVSHSYRDSNFADVNHGWVVDIGGTLYVTSDGGRDWTEIKPAPPFSDVRQLDFISPQVGWAVSQAPPWLQKTVDGGHTWAPVAYTISQQ